MKKLIYFLIVVIFFGYVFLKSGTWVITKEVTKRGSTRITNYKHDLEWDRFFSYLKNIPKYISEDFFKKPQ
ncbi:MAG: hypothetical protein ABII88_02770 [Candidatus Omnitrophota bacterium]